MVVVSAWVQGHCPDVSVILLDLSCYSVYWSIIMLQGLCLFNNARETCADMSILRLSCSS